MEGIAIDDFLKSDFYTEQATMIDTEYENKQNEGQVDKKDNDNSNAEENDRDEESNDQAPKKKRKYEKVDKCNKKNKCKVPGKTSKIRMRENLYDQLDVLENISTDSVNRNVRNKITKDGTLQYTLEMDAVDGFSDTVKNGIQYISDKIEGFKSIIDEIIGAEFINMLITHVKALQHHFTSSKSLSLSYVKELFTIFETFITSISKLTVL